MAWAGMKAPTAAEGHLTPSELALLDTLISRALEQGASIERFWVDTASGTVTSIAGSVADAAEDAGRQAIKPAEGWGETAAEGSPAATSEDLEDILQALLLQQITPGDAAPAPEEGLTAAQLRSMRRLLLVDAKPRKAGIGR
jgi:hypothetical protein